MHGADDNARAEGNPGMLVDMRRVYHLKKILKGDAIFFLIFRKVTEMPHDRQCEAGLKRCIKNVESYK